MFGTHWLASVDHVHHDAAASWWETQSGAICFTRPTQLGFLRLATTAAAMQGKPLTMAGACQAYEWFFDDIRVLFFPEPPGVEAEFRRATSDATTSLKVWADAWLFAVARAAGGVLVTFDRALGERGAQAPLGQEMTMLLDPRSRHFYLTQLLFRKLARIPSAAERANQLDAGGESAAVQVGFGALVLDQGALGR